MSTDDDIPLVFRTSCRLRRDELRDFLREISRRIARANVACLITSDDELRRFNKEFRGKNYATDVLSFPAAAVGVPASTSRKAARAIGDLAISVDRAKAQAAEHGHSLHDELKILMLHGVLHLAGMDHETDHGEMRRAEIRWRKRLALPISLIERTQNSGAAAPEERSKPTKARTKSRVRREAQTATA